MAVLLIGSTGNGKSTLGNYLLDPDCLKKGATRYFKTAKDNYPQTQNTTEQRKTVSVKDMKQDLALIDTPGLNESKVKDLTHMVELINTLQQTGEIRACIFVVKFSAKIDQQYIDTIEYYSKLLPSLFENNVLITVTDYATDPRSKGTREAQGIKDEEIFGNIQKQIMKSAGLTFLPMLVAIDCLPYTDEERVTSLNARESILSYIFSLEAVDVKNLKVAKTKAVMEEDQRLIEKYEGEIGGYQHRLQEAEENAKQALDKTRQRQKDLTDLDSEMAKLKDSLQEKNSNSLVTVGCWSINSPWKLFKVQSKSFSVFTSCDINKVDQWTDGNCKLEITEMKEREVKGKVKGERLRGLYANVTLKARKKVKYESEIEELRSALEQKRIEYAKAKEFAEEHQQSHDEFKEVIEKFKKYIEGKRADIVKHSSTTFSLEEALVRLEKLSKQD